MNIFSPTYGGARPILRMATATRGDALLAVASASLIPSVQQIAENVQKLVAAVETLVDRPVAADLTDSLNAIQRQIADLPREISAAVNFTPVLTNLTTLTETAERGAVLPRDLAVAAPVAPVAPVEPVAPVAPEDPVAGATTPATPTIDEAIKDVNYALQQAIEQYNNYVRNAGDSVPYLKRPYRAEVYGEFYYDVAEPQVLKRRFKTRGVLALVPCREFSNILATGCGAIGQAITALANARSARARAHVQHPHADMGVLRMNTVVVGHPAGPASRGVVPLDAPGHLAMALHDDIAVAEIALRQAYHELEGKLSPYEAFRVFPPGDARRYVPVPTDPTDVEAMFRHAASLEVTLALDRILTRVHVRSEPWWPMQGVNPFDTIDALAKHVYGIITPRTQPSKETLDKERREVESLARQVAEHEERQREARIYREAREAAREAGLEAARLARQARLVARV